MKPRLIILSLCLLAGAATAQHGLNFGDYFVDKALRVDLYQIGDAREEWVTVDRDYARFKGLRWHPPF